MNPHTANYYAALAATEINQHHTEHIVRVNNLIAGLQLLRDHYRIYVSAHRNEIWCTVIDEANMTEEDKNKLVKLGWRHNQMPMAWWCEVR